MTIRSNMTIEDYMKSATGRFKIIRQDLKPQKDAQSSSPSQFNGILSSFTKPSSHSSKTKSSNGMTIMDYREHSIPLSHNLSMQQAILSKDNALSSGESVGSVAKKDTPEFPHGSESPITQPVFPQTDTTGSKEDIVSQTSITHLLETQSSGFSKSDFSKTDSQSPSDSTRKKIEKAISDAAVKYQLSNKLIKGVIKTESDYDVNAVSPAGAQGLMQLMPETARELGVTKPFDITQNINGGARYLRQMVDMFGGNIKKALAAYNAGPGTVKKYNGNVPYSETRQYVEQVIDNTKTAA